MILRTMRTNLAQIWRRLRGQRGQRGLRARKVDCLSTSISIPQIYSVCISRTHKPHCPHGSGMPQGSRYLMGATLKGSLANG